MNKNLLLILMGFGLIGCVSNTETGLQFGLLNIEVSKESKYIWDTVLVKDYENLNKNYPRSEAIDIISGKKFHIGHMKGSSEAEVVYSAKRFCGLIHNTTCVTSRINDNILIRDLDDYLAQAGTRAKKSKEYEAKIAKINANTEARAKLLEAEKKQRTIAMLSKRCESYGFTGESNIAACIQREAQHDKELAIQKYELQKTRLALQKAQSNNYAQTYAEPIQEDDDLPFLIKFLGEVAVEVAENLSDPTYIQLQQQQQQINQLKANQNRDIYRNCRPNC